MIELKVILTEFLESIKDYEHEADKAINDDDRDSEYFAKLFLQNNPEYKTKPSSSLQEQPRYTYEAGKKAYEKHKSLQELLEQVDSNRIPKINGSVIKTKTVKALIRSYLGVSAEQLPKQVTGERVELKTVDGLELSPTVTGWYYERHGKRYIMKNDFPYESIEINGSEK